MFLYEKLYKFACLILICYFRKLIDGCYVCLFYIFHIYFVFICLEFYISLYLILFYYMRWDINILLINGFKNMIIPIDYKMRVILKS
jgi:hypothetical protein